jgi:hypothetical protein
MIQLAERVDLATQRQHHALVDLEDALDGHALSGFWALPDANDPHPAEPEGFLELEASDPLGSLGAIGRALALLVLRRSRHQIEAVEAVVEMPVDVPRQIGGQPAVEESQHEPFV